MTMEIEFLGMKLSSPFIVASCPVSYDAEGIIRAHKAGAGAVVTKTIRDQAAENPYPHITLSGSQSLLNAEKWSDLPAEQWIEEEIPRAKETGVNLIASVGHTQKEVENWARKIEKAGADALELVSYSRSDMLPMIRTARAETSLPVIAKISPNWPDPVESGIKAVEAGADAITAIDSLGPVFRVDIHSGKAMVGGAGGRGWLTGAAIQPVSQAIVAGIASQVVVPVIGVGGVTGAEEAVEMLMSGASAVGLCSTLLLKGVESLEKLNQNTEQLIEKLGYDSIDRVSGQALDVFARDEVRTKFNFNFDQEKCIECNRCVDFCPYQARTLNYPRMELNEQRCRFCGYCASVCPVEALIIEEG